MHRVYLTMYCNRLITAVTEITLRGMKGVLSRAKSERTNLVDGKIMNALAFHVLSLMPPAEELCSFLVSLILMLRTVILNSGASPGPPGALLS